jgi:hypothetical protein
VPGQIQFSTIRSRKICPQGLKYSSKWNINRKNSKL